jgi:hypothetical protein
MNQANRALADRSNAMSQVSRDTRKTPRHGLLWFVALWLLGVGGTALLVLPFHLLVAAAMHH